MARAHGPLPSWQGTAARVMAARLAANLGGRRLAWGMQLRTFRADPEDGDAAYYGVSAIHARRGPAAAWGVLRTMGDFPRATDRQRSDLLTLRASVAADFRDFDAADALLAQAEEAAPDRLWTATVRAQVLREQDRPEEALAMARRALEMRPWYRPALQEAGELLQRLGRDADAVELLREGCRRLESGSVAAQLSALLEELGHAAEALEAVERAAALTPLAEPAFLKWVAGRRCDVACELGDLPRAAEQARAADSPFFRKVADRLARAGPADRKVLLPVPSVRQNRDTCAPATLAALGSFWSMPTDHLELADAICYDGTPSHSQRRWAEEHGWAAREFTVTVDAARALLDRGVPFTLTTVDPGNAHLQAVIGYDDRRGTFLIRDPSFRTTTECAQDALLEHYRSTGPRGMALVPAARAALVDGVPFAEADLYDGLYQVERALDRHDRETARGAAEAIEARSPGHRLALLARRALAAYDADRDGLLACTEALLRLHPDDANLELSRLSLLQDLARRDERLERLRRICEDEDGHPIFWPLYARELCADARRWPRALEVLRRSVAANPHDGSSLELTAELLWHLGRREEALEYHRFAACVEDKNEGYAESYFQASRHLRRTAEAVLFLRGRVRRYGGLSSWPARTLFWALDQLEQTPAAFAALEEALRRRPDDAELRLYAADARARYGEFDRAGELLAGAEGKARPASLLRAEASLDVHRGESRSALARWRRILEAEPLSMDAHAAVARLLAETEGRAAAFGHLREAAARFPHHAALHQLRIEWLREGDPEEYEAAIRTLIGANPTHAWARRELAFHLCLQRRLEEGFEHADEAARLSPSSPVNGLTRARLLEAGGKLEEAREACRSAIRISVDFEPATDALVGLARSNEERKEALAFVHSELVRQVVFGEGLLQYRSAGRGTLDAEEMLRTLREALAARPDLWHAWSAIVNHTSEMGRLDESRDLAREATAKFPLVPRLWLDLAYVLSLRSEPAAEREALEQALRIVPGWGPAVRQLAGAHERAGDYAKSRELLERAVARDPLDSRNLGGLAWALWRLGDHDAAIRRLEQAVLADPGYEWAWSTLSEWAAEMKRPHVPVRLAEDLARRRPGESRSWFTLARALSPATDLGRCLEALDRAASLDPSGADPHDFKASLLAGAGRYEEALAACAYRAPGEARPPLTLRGRAAWIEAQRGNRAGAIRAMREVVSGDPGYYWGWTCLANWYREEGSNLEYLEASKQVARLAPQSGTAFAYLGDACLKGGDKKGALEAFARAFELAPDNAFAGGSLFDLELDGGKLDEAEATLGRLRVHEGGIETLSRAVRLETARRRFDEAARRLCEMCTMDVEDRSSLEAAHEAMVAAGRRADAERVYRAAAREGKGVSPHAAALWIRCLTPLEAWGECRRALRELRDRPVLWRAAAVEYLEALAGAGEWVSTRWFLFRHREELRGHSVTWGTGGYALYAIGATRAAARWLADWRGRNDLRPWMLMNLVLSLRAEGRDAEAQEAGRKALSLPPDGSLHPHRLWLAFDEAAGGDPARAAEVVDHLDGAELPPYYRSLHLLIRAMVHARRGDAELARLRFGDGVALAGRERAFRRAVRRAVACIARARGGLAGAAWGLWKRLNL